MGVGSLRVRVTLYSGTRVSCLTPRGGELAWLSIDVSTDLVGRYAEVWATVKLDVCVRLRVRVGAGVNWWDVDGNDVSRGRVVTATAYLSGASIRSF
jgi:hypothetical protein